MKHRRGTDRIPDTGAVNRAGRSKNQRPEYAIVDIETTGGNASGSRITEIAIRIHNGESEIDRFDSLINPGRPIPPAIWSLTGISNAMVEDAPYFAEVAERIFTLLKDRVFVAHNVNFDYSFIRHELEEAGYSWNPTKLCTVRMSRKLCPGLGSYSLGNLCSKLSIPISNRHRAGGDVDATTLLFERLLALDKEGAVAEMQRRSSGDQRLPPNVSRSDVEQLPPQPGVYYFMDKTGKVLYVGKAVNLKKRVVSHFSGHSARAQRQQFLRHVYRISFEVCATELMALLLECIEIKRLWPPFNRALKRFEPKYGLLVYEDQLGYKRLAVGRLQRFQACLQVFNREIEGVRMLRSLVDRFDLDVRYCNFGLRGLPAFRRVEEGATAKYGPEPAPEVHNRKVGAALACLEAERPTFMIIDKGRSPDEKSCIWVEKGNLYAMGYIASESDLHTAEAIRDSLPRYYGNDYIMQLIYTFAASHPGKIRRLQGQT